MLYRFHFLLVSKYRIIFEIVGTILQSFSLHSEYHVNGTIGPHVCRRYICIFHCYRKTELYPNLRKKNSRMKLDINDIQLFSKISLLVLKMFYFYLSYGKLVPFHSPYTSTSHRYVFIFAEKNPEYLK